MAARAGSMRGNTNEAENVGHDFSFQPMTFQYKLDSLLSEKVKVKCRKPKVGCRIWHNANNKGVVCGASGKNGQGGGAESS